MTTTISLMAQLSRRLSSANARSTIALEVYGNGIGAVSHVIIPDGKEKHTVTELFLWDTEEELRAKLANYAVTMGVSC